MTNQNRLAVAAIAAIIGTMTSVAYGLVSDSNRKLSLQDWRNKKPLESDSSRENYVPNRDAYDIFPPIPEREILKLDFGKFGDPRT